MYISKAFGNFSDNRTIFALYQTVMELNYIIIFAAGVLVIAAFSFIFNKREGSSSSKIADTKLRDLTAQLQTVTKENEKLKAAMKSLQEYTHRVEMVNLELMAQKEKLEYNKIRLTHLQKQKEQFFATVVHDIKNPASSIKGFVELLENYDHNAEEQHEIMRTILAASASILDLAQKISVQIANQDGDHSPQYIKTSLKAIIDTVCSRNMVYAKSKKVKLINSSSDSLPYILIDKEKIGEAIENLVNNAIKYAPAETNVLVKAYYSDENVTVEVADDGVGIADEDLKKIFGKGAVLSNKPTGGEKQSGLGLWIVKSFVEEHGGNVSIKTKLGAGSVFKIELPRKSGTKA